MKISFTRMARSGLAAGLMLAVVGAGVLLAGPQSTASAEEPSDNGQLTRRGFSGNVVAVDSTSIVVETRFGNITAGTTNAEISFPGPAPEGSEEPRVIVVGDRVGVLLDRSPGTSTSTPITISESDDDTAASSTPPAPSFRSVEALRITVIPSKATRTHLRGVVKENANGRIKILRGDGTEEEFDGPPGLAGAAGDDLLFIVKRGPSGGPGSVTNTVSEDEIIDRLDALAAAAEDNPELAESLSRLRGNVNDKRLQRLEALVESSDPEDLDLVNGAITRARGKSAGKGGGDSGTGGNSGSQGQGGGNSGAGGNSGSQGQGGGNSGTGGNSGGGGGKSGNQGNNPNN